ncbi:MAG: hypothetical protein JSR93_04430, partial [Verrucomicrobia bacterium]|nr:hypothetical protein [Verrucomicrobiota bacterium]
ANLLIQEVYPLAFSIPAFVDLCTQYINSGVTPPLDDATKQIYTYLNAQNWFLDLSLYQISNYIMNPASSNRTLEAWEGIMASLYHPQDSNSISALWNLWKMMDTWHATHYPLYAQSLPQPLLNDVTALYHTWLGITAESIDPNNHNNILHQLASGLIAIDTDLTNLINNQQPLTANEKMLQYVLYAPPQGGFIVPFIQYAKEFVTSPTPRNAADFSNFVAGCNFYIASVLYNSLNANLSIHKRWEPRLQLE